MGTKSFHGVKAARADVEHPSPTSTKVKEREDLYLYSPSGLSWSVLGPTLPSPFYPPVIILPKPHPVHPYRDRPEQTAHYRPQTHLMATTQRNKGTTVLRSETSTTALLQIQFHGM
jgi:hypothetical protein